MKYLITTLLIVLIIAGCAEMNMNEKITSEIEKGNYTEAENLIDGYIAEGDLNDSEVRKLQFVKTRLERIKKDFSKKAEDIYPYIRTYYPEADENMLKRWEDDGSLEYMVIDGEKYYFNRAHTNLFRINKEAKKKKEEVDGTAVDELEVFLTKYLPKVIEKRDYEGSYDLINPVTIKYKYTLTVEPNAVPAGEVIKAWLPYPREGNERQQDIELLSVNDDDYTVADKEVLQRTLYIEKEAVKDEPTIFQYELTYESYVQKYNITPAAVLPYDENTGEYKLYTSERAPHIVFTDEIKALSDKIVGGEENPYLKAKKIFTWISENIPWAGAREYSTLENIPAYCLERMHGDCGIKSLLFITLCRYNGIPAKWQSGWMLHPGKVNLHDWSEVYINGYGWVPVDQSFGLQPFEEEELKYFYLGGMDAYRLIVNDDYSKPLDPAKEHFRSETVDFQRGEVEWSGGNLYFDKWNYRMEVEYYEDEDNVK